MVRRTKKALEEIRKKTLDVVESGSAVLPMRHKCDLGKLGKLVLSEWGRPNSRVISRHFGHNRANRTFMSRSNRSYGLISNKGT